MIPGTGLSEKKAAGWFWGLTGFFAILWIVLPSVMQSGYRYDVVELQFIGKEWVLSTAKHPMLPAWLLEVVNLLTDRAFAAPFIAGQLCTLASLCIVRAFARKVLSERLALFGTLSMLPYWYFSLKTANYNQNIALIPLWTLSIWLTFRAFQNNRWCDWAGAGAAIGAAAYAKYSIVFLVAAILLYSFFEPKARKRWFGYGPWLSLATAVLVIIPDFLWLWQHDFICLRYVQEQAANSKGILDRIICILAFIASQSYYVLPSVVILLPFLGRRWKKRQCEDPLAIDARKYLAAMIFLPFALHLAMPLLFEMRLVEGYGAPFWPLFGVFLLLCFQAREGEAAENRSLGLVVLIELLTCLILVFQSLLYPYVTGNAHAVQFPYRDLAAACDRIWSEKYAAPCPYVTGHWRLAGFAAHGMKDRPSVLFYAKGNYPEDGEPTGTWARDSDINERGGLVLWELPDKAASEGPVQDSGFLKQRYPRAETVPEPLILHYKTGAKVPPLRVGVAIVPPADGGAGSGK